MEEEPKKVPLTPVEPLQPEPIKLIKKEELENTPEDIEESIKNRPKGVISMQIKEIDVNGKRVMFKLSEAEESRHEVAMSFTELKSIVEQINIEESRR